MTWIVFALLSAVFVSLRHLYIKKYCAAVPSDVLIFITRLFGAFLYLPFLLLHPIHLNPAHTFWGVLVLTVVVTAGATIVQVRVIQKAEISLSVPFLSLIPLLMIPMSMLILKQHPPLLAWLGLVLGSLGAWMIQRTGQSATVHFRQIPAGVTLLMLGVALALALTTTCDKIAIDASSALVYAGFWTIVSAGFMFLISLRHSVGQIRAAIKNRHTLIQAGFWAVAFAAQMLAVQKVSVESGVVYVKMLTMLHILMSVLVGGFHFKEKQMVKRLVGAGLMVIGAGVTVWMGSLG